MTIGSIRGYVAGVLAELKRDEQFISMLKKLSQPSKAGPAAEWVSAAEKLLGRRVSQSNMTAVTKFVTKHWPALLRASRGDTSAAKKQLFKALDSRYLTRL